MLVLEFSSLGGWVVYGGDAWWQDSAATHGLCTTHFLICCYQRDSLRLLPWVFHRTPRAWLPSEGIHERVPDSSHRHFITPSQKRSHCPPIACLQEAAQQVPPISQGKELETHTPLNRHPLRSYHNRRDANFKAVFPQLLCVSCPNAVWSWTFFPLKRIKHGELTSLG